MTFTNEQQVLCIFLLRMHIKILKLSQSNSVQSIYCMNFLHRQCITDRKLNFDTDYKQGQKRLQIGAGSEITKQGKSVTKRGKKITNRGRDYKLVEKNMLTVKPEYKHSMIQAVLFFSAQGCLQLIHMQLPCDNQFIASTKINLAWYSKTVKITLNNKKLHRLDNSQTNVISNWQLQLVIRQSNVIAFLTSQSVILPSR